MNLRHAAAVALVGWYVMLPPLNEATGKIERLAPLSAWEQFTEFDSSSECHSFLNGIASSYQDILKNQRFYRDSDPKWKESAEYENF